MKASKNAHNWHCEAHDTYGWVGEECRKCPVAPSETTALREQVEKLTKENGRLRNALIGLVGSDSREELQSMELAMRIFPASDADVVASVNAIHALLETMQEDKP